MRIGVCSWSLRPEGPKDLADKVRACGVDAVQLALEPLRTRDWDEAETVQALRAAGITVLSGMMKTRGEDYSTLGSIRRTGGLVPDEHWEENLRTAKGCAAVADRLGRALVTFHAGFLPPGMDDPSRQTMLERLRRVADAFGSCGIGIGLETGQESAGTLAAFLRQLNHPGVGVNFDPANMILYGMGDPVEALKTLAPWVRQIHVKDAVPTRTPGTWGEEVPVGQGVVDWPAFFQVVREKCAGVNLLIEREAGKARVEDIRGAVDLIRRHYSG